MWTPTTRKQHSRRTTRYQTDLTDEEWRVIEPHLPAAKSTGRPRAWPMREIINGIFYVMRSGMPVAAAAKRSAALEHDLSLVCDVPRRRPLREHQSRTGHARSRTDRTPGQSHRRDHR